MKPIKKLRQRWLSLSHGGLCGLEFGMAFVGSFLSAGCLCFLSHEAVGRVWQQAAECVAASESQRLGVTVTIKDSKKKWNVARPRSYSIRRPHRLLPIFQKALLPADLSAAVEHVESACVMYRSEPALEHISLISKYGPCKACLFTAWQNHLGQQPPRGFVASKHDPGNP